MRTAIIKFLGVEYLGLNNLFAAVLQVLNLAELGVGNAMVFSMYKPFAEGDSKKICALMRLYKIYYRVIGCVVAGIGLVLVPFIPKLIRGDVPPSINVYVLYLLNLGATVLTYWLFAYKNSLLTASQNSSVASKVTIVIDIIKYAVQLFVLWQFENYYLYVIVLLLSQAVSNIAIAVVVTKKYPEYTPTGEMDKAEVKEINQRVRDLFASKVGGVIVNSADAIVISAFLGLTVLAIYQNYYFILSSVIGFITVIFNACTAGIGNSLLSETKEKNYTDLKKFTFLIAWIAGLCSCLFLNLFQPFMSIWVGEDLMLGYPAVICFVVYFYVYEINQLLNTYKSAGGIWHKDRFRTLITAFTNLILNLVSVNHFGIYGVLFSTVLSTLFIGMPWLIHNLFTLLFEKKHIKEYLKNLFEYTFVTLLVCLVCGSICSLIKLGPWPSLIIRALICMIVPNVIYILVYRKKKEYHECVQLADNMTKGKLGLSRLFAHSTNQNGKLSSGDTKQ